MSAANANDRALGMALLRETIEKVHDLQMESWNGRQKGPGTVAFMLDGIENRLEVAESMLREDGEWRLQTRNRVAKAWLEREAEWKAGEEGKGQ